MPRHAEPEDLVRFRIPTDPRTSPDGRWAVFTLQSVAPKRDGYRHAIWLVPTDGSAPARQLTLGANHDRQARAGRWPNGVYPVSNGRSAVCTRLRWTSRRVPFRRSS